MDDKELCELVQKISLDTMNHQGTAGVIYHCFDDEEIVAKYGHLTTEAEITKAVTEYEKSYAEYVEDIENF